MRLCTLWLIQGNGFFLLVSFGRGRSFGICDFASSLAVHLLIAGIGLMFYVVYKNKDYQNDTGAGSFVVSLALS